MFYQLSNLTISYWFFSTKTSFLFIYLKLVIFVNRWHQSVLWWNLSETLLTPNELFLFQIVTSSYTDLQDYTYYFVPAPWLSVKLLRLLQFYGPPDDPASRGRLNECLETILNKAQVCQIKHKHLQLRYHGQRTVSIPLVTYPLSLLYDYWPNKCFNLWQSWFVWPSDIQFLYRLKVPNLLWWPNKIFDGEQVRASRIWNFTWWEYN